MSKRNVTQEVRTQMKTMIDKKAKDLEAIRKKQTEARTQLEAAELGIKSATEAMDLDAYEKASDAKAKAVTALNMYSGRYNQIQKQEYISEEESDKVIDSLKAYEKELADDFKKEAKPLLKKLAVLHDAYSTAVQEAEDTMLSWTRQIHANYRVEGARYADGTNRNSSPQPVRQLPYTGCAEAQMLDKYLQKAKDLYVD